MDICSKKWRINLIKSINADKLIKFLTYTETI